MRAISDLVVVAHAEDGGLTDGTVATEGETATRLGLPAAPAIAEALAVARDLMLAEETGARVHFRQVTTAAGFDLIRAAKRRGVRVTCGITPAHLFLSDIAMSDFRTFARLSPPLRDESDRQAALAVADGTIDVIASGHDPRGPEAKRLPFADAEPGMAGAETLLALSLGLVRDERIPIERLFALLAANPAKIFGLKPARWRPACPPTSSCSTPTPRGRSTPNAWSPAPATPRSTPARPGQGAQACSRAARRSNSCRSARGGDPCAAVIVEGGQFKPCPEGEGCRSLAACCLAEVG
jgi:dihydroorotase-like cyclic amidohydrolase